MAADLPRDLRVEKQLAEMAAVAPVRLSAAGEATLKAEFGKQYDNARLVAGMQQKLVEYFAGEGQDLTDVKVMLVVNKNHPERTEVIGASC